ncbi:MAG: hypothetical protein AB3N15_04210 [Paracoccaceae bacterium]
MPFATVAITYRASTAATTICALEAAGFDVLCPGYLIANTLPHFALAIGGISIKVPASQAQDAVALLRSFHVNEQSETQLTSKLLNGVGWLVCGASSPWPDIMIREPDTPMA